MSGEPGQTRGGSSEAEQDTAEGKGNYLSRRTVGCMEVTLGVLADAANRADNGKLNMLGVFQTLYAYEVPARHPQMCLVLVFKDSPGEKGTTQRIKVVLMDEDGTQLGTPPEIMLDIPSDLPGLGPQFELILN